MLSRRSGRIVLLLVVLVGLLSLLAPASVRAECGVYHTVLRGQNLFRISLHYGVSMREIAAANSIANINRIYVGQQLYIPCAGTAAQPSTVVVPVTSVVTTTTATTTSTVTTGVGAQVIDCTGFRATSPLDGLKDGTNTFYWDPPRSGASITGYQVIVMDDRGARVAAYSTAGGITRVSGDTSLGAIGGRSRFSWYVIASASGAEVCRSQLTTLNRDWNPYAGLSPRS